MIVATVLRVHVFLKYIAMDTLIYVSAPDPARGRGIWPWRNGDPAPLACSTSDAVPLFLSPCALYSHSQRSCQPQPRGSR